MPFGDVAFQGFGPKGVVSVGIEYKKFGELLDAITTGRLVGHQLRGMILGKVEDGEVGAGKFDVNYLLIEGIFTVDPKNGLLQIRKRVKRNGYWKSEWADAGRGGRRWSYAQLMEFLNGLPCRVLITRSQMETCHTLFALHQWWSKPWEKHSAMKVIYQGMNTRSRKMGEHDDEFVPMAPVLTHVSPERRTFASIPDVGWEYSAAAEEEFGTHLIGCLAPASAWANLRADGLTADGRRRPRIGLKRAKRIVQFLTGRG